MTWGLKDEQIKKIKNVFTRFKQIHEVILFGSRVKGNYKLGSDIDFAIKGSELGLNDLLNLYNMLDDLDLPYKFDLFIYNQIKDNDVIEHINRVGVNFYKIDHVNKKNIN